MSEQRLPVSELDTATKEMDLGSAKAYHLPDWHQMSHPQRLKVIRQIAMMRGRDPRISKLAVSVLRKSGARPRNYEDQAAALLKWVQDPNNCYYVNEPGERLQDPIYTIEAKHGDCDDQVLLLCAMFESVGLSWRLCLCGKGPNGEKVRYIEGADVPGGTKWVHIYCVVGTPPFRPTRWYYCEPTIEGVPLGWDVISGDRSYIPEAARKAHDKRGTGPIQVVEPGKAPLGFKPRPHSGSPAYKAAYGQSALVSAVSGAVGEEVESSTGQMDWKKIMAAVATGVAVSVFAQLTLDWVRGKGIWEGGGSIPIRLARGRGSVQDSKFSAPSPFSR